MSELRIEQFPCLDDNYGFLLHDPDTGATAAIDTPDPDVIAAELDRHGWRLTHILNTHHHGDHAGGNVALKARFGCTVVGPGNDAARIPGIDVGVVEGDQVAFGNTVIDVLETPGHTRGHVVYYVAAAGAGFVGDTLFAMGCGRLFEGTPAQMAASLEKLLRWPDDTRIYCAHEYTQANGQFALSVEPGNQALVERMQDVIAARGRSEPTVPTTLALEKATNPFLRTDSEDLRRTIGVDGDSVAVFAKTRALKDAFRPV